jgi:[calcium/calmodulin-dependent protein kinase] kinase
VMQEIEIMKQLDHENIVKLHEVIEDPKKDLFFLIIDYAAQGQLIDWDDEKRKFFFRHKYPGKFFSEEYLRKFFRDIIKGLNHCKKITKNIHLSIVIFFKTY